MGEAETTGEEPSVKQIDDELRAFIGGKKKFILLSVEGESGFRFMSNVSENDVIDILIVAIRAQFQETFKHMVKVARCLDSEKRALIEQLKKARLDELEKDVHAS